MRLPTAAVCRDTLPRIHTLRFDKLLVFNNSDSSLPLLGLLNSGQLGKGRTYPHSSSQVFGSLESIRGDPIPPPSRSKEGVESQLMRKRI